MGENTAGIQRLQKNSNPFVWRRCVTDSMYFKGNLGLSPKSRQHSIGAETEALTCPYTLHFPPQREEVYSTTNKILALERRKSEEGRKRIKV